MFRLEKIFQHDDLFFVNIFILAKSFVFFMSIYIFSILEFNSIFELSKIEIYMESKYFHLSFYAPILFLLFSSIFNKKKKKFLITIKSFLLDDILFLIISLSVSLIIFFIFMVDFNLDIHIVYLILLTFFSLSINKLLFGKIYNVLLDDNIIQRNILLVGSVENIKKILNEKKDKINIYKCCLIKSDKDSDLLKTRLEIKIPIFTQNADIRSILEYHALGQIWILDDHKPNNVNYYLKYVIKFSVDILIINLKDKLNNNLKIQNNDLINRRYTYINYEVSRFYGASLFVKILIDKFFSIIFLLMLSPVLILSMILIYIEDGSPIFFTQDRTGWDGRRFKIFKLRSLKATKFDRTIQVTDDDTRFLKIGKLIRRFSIDEVPQFFNVLIGDMSIVGPRPHMVEHDIQYAKIFNSFLKRHKTNPGLTGWAQVSGHRGATPTPEHMKKRMDADLWYMNNWTIWLDLFIIIKTFYIIFAKPGK